jgi:AcrR family transcriptional regulator
MTRRFVRARKPEQKDQRRAQLLGTARALLEGGVALRELSLNELARRAGMAKANVYRYFETREAVLLALLWEEWVRWFAALARPWQDEAGGVVTLDALVTRLSRSLTREPLLCALTAALPSVLEQNLSEEASLTFRRATLAALDDLGAILAARCPALPAEGYAEFLNDTASAITGLYPATHPSAAAARVLAAPELRFFRRDFAEELERFMRALAADRGRRHAAAQTPSRATAAAKPRGAARGRARR